jgi:hypothetical protein
MADDEDDGCRSGSMAGVGGDNGNDTSGEGGGASSERSKEPAPPESSIDASGGGQQWQRRRRASQQPTQTRQLLQQSQLATYRDDHQEDRSNVISAHEYEGDVQVKWADGSTSMAFPALREGTSSN